MGKGRRFSLTRKSWESTGGDLKALTCLTYQIKWSRGDPIAPSNYIREEKQPFKPNGNARTKTNYRNTIKMEIQWLLQDLGEALQQLSWGDGGKE